MFLCTKVYILQHERQIGSVQWYKFWRYDFQFVRSWKFFHKCCSYWCFNKICAVANQKIVNFCDTWVRCWQPVWNALENFSRFYVTATGLNLTFINLNFNSIFECSNFQHFSEHLELCFNLEMTRFHSSVAMMDKCIKF